MNNASPRRPWQWDIPEFFNIGEACTRHGRDPARCDQTAITVDSGGGDDDSLSYQQLDYLSRCFADALIALGLAPRQRVMIRLPNSIDYPVAFMGTLLAGGIAVPASTQLTATEMAFLGDDAGVSVLVCTQQDLGDLREVIESLPDLQHVIVTQSTRSPSLTNTGVHAFSKLLDESRPLEQHYPSRADDPAYLVYTSGTTSSPKGVLHAHRALLGRQPASEYWFDFADDDCILHSGKLNWTYVLGTAMMDPFYRGKSVVLYEGPPGPQVWPSLIAKHRCTIFIGVPTVYRQILHRTTAGSVDVPSLRYCMCAGEHLSDDVLQQWQKRFEQDIYEAVGMSECSYYLSHHPSRPIVAGTAGLPQPGHNVALLDEQMQAVAVEEEGMLCIPLDDPGLFLKYWERERETASSRRQGYFLTGDYGARDHQGYIHFRGRKDDMINSLGYRISPLEIERVIKAMPEVADCVVIGEDTDSGACIVCACIIPQGDTPLSAGTVTTYAARHLASYKVPKKIRCMTSFPRTANGKVLRRALKAAIVDSAP